MGQLIERLAAEKISVSACDLRELTCDRRVHLGVAVADAERRRAAISPPSVPSNGISTVPVDTCVTASCFAANRLIARTREASFEVNRRFIRIGSQWHSDIGSWEVRFTIPLISAGQEPANLPHRVIDLHVECALPQLRR
jgi:hypothetical protein